MGNIEFQQDGKLPAWFFRWVCSHITRVHIRQGTKWAIWTKPAQNKDGGK